MAPLYQTFQTIHVWLWIILTMVFSVLVVYVYSFSKNMLRLYSIANMFRMFLVPLINANQSQLQRRAMGQERFIGKTAGSWLLCGLVFTNAYKGIIVSLMAIPPAHTGLWETFEQIQNFTIYTSIKKNPWKSKPC